MVIESVAELGAALQAARHAHSGFVEAQRKYLHDSIGQVIPGESAGRGAEAIVHFMRGMS